MTVFKLPRLPVNWKDQPGLFERYWDDATRKIEETFNSILSIPAIEAALVAVTAATAAATAAAAGANTAANTAAAATALTNSYPTGVTITGTDVGASVTVSVSAHNRTYPPSTTVSVSAGNVTGLSYSTTYYIYYDDPTRAGGAVTFLATTSTATAAQTGNRHLVGSVLTPAAAASPTNGKNVEPPGVGNIP